MKCPGQDTQYWNQDAIFNSDCPHCGQPVEFYKDDTTRTCRQCGHRFVNPRMDFGCAAYCSFAEQCIGTLPEEFVGFRDNLLKDKVAVSMKRLYRDDFKAIGRMMRIARHAGKIATQEKADLPVVLCAAYLLDNTSQPVRDEHGVGSTSQQITVKSSAHARKLLTELGAKQEMIEAVCTLLTEVASPSAMASSEKNALSDAHLITHLEEQYQDGQVTDTQVADLLARNLTSDGGRVEARASFHQIALLS